MKPRASQIDDACRGAARYIEIGGRLQEQAGPPSPDHPLAPFVLAFHYDFVERDWEDRRAEFGPYAPLMETPSVSFPPKLDELPDEIVEAWVAVVDECHEPAACARLGDLLWVRRHGSEAYRYAQTAIDANLELAERWTDIERADCLGRALELSLELRDRERAARVVTELLVATRAAIEDEEWKPGVSLRMLQLLVELDAPPDGVNELLAAAGDRYASDPFILDSISDLLAADAGGDPERIREIRQEQARRWLQVADGAEGLVALAHLQHGLAVARTHGLGEDAAEFELALQSIDRDSMDFAKVRAEVPIEHEVVEEIVESLVGADWPTTLGLIGSFGPPSGDLSRNEQTVRELMKNYPVQFLFTRTVLGPEGSIVMNVGQEAQFAAQLSEYERQQTQFFALVLTEALRRALDRLGKPDRLILVDYFAAGPVSNENADAFARGILHYVDGLHDECALVVVPRVEAVLRELARGAGLVVTRAPSDRLHGGVRSLGEVPSRCAPRSTLHGGVISGTRW